MKDLLPITSHFALSGTPTQIAPVGNGLINDTYRVECGEQSYILQRINHHIFKDVELLQHNIQTVTDHIRTKLAAEGYSPEESARRTLTLTPTTAGALYHFDGESYWRMMGYIVGSRTHESMSSDLLAERTGEAFGQFQQQLSDLPEGALGETIPDFHNLEFRLEGLRAVIAADPVGRVAEVQELIDELLKRADELCLAQRLYREGKLPKRVTHCDTKINNLLFDEQDNPLCVIDLDTTMPGFVLSDVGDFIRTGANRGAEDDTDLDRVEVNIPIFKAFIKGYLSTAGAFLTPTERELLPYGGKMLTYMQTVRFLADYLAGDTYYKIQHPSHNLQRTRAQFKLLQSLEAHEAEMNDYIRTL